MQEFDLSIKTLKDNLYIFDCGFWSKYDRDKRISSPFYHNLHIAQMEALGLVFDEIEFKQYYTLFKKYKKICSSRHLHLS